MKNITALVALSVLGIACGGSDDVSDFVPEATPATNAAEEIPSLGENSNVGPSTSLESCATATVAGTIAPVHLVIAQDISGSMCQLPSESIDIIGANCSRPGTKWQLTLAALNAFFSDPASVNSHASVITWSGATCSPFETPLAPKDVALPDVAGSLSLALKASAPNGATPTSVAIDGAVKYAKKLQSTLTDGGKVVVALATDGSPTSCGGLPTALTSAASAKTQGFAPYVIGVGSLIPKLDSIASAAGTNGGKAFLVQANIAKELNDALKAIKQQSISCALKLPAAPAGQSLDFGRVNVVSNDGKGDVTVPYSQDCANASGWKYAPNASNPDSIELCKSRCDVLKAATKKAEFKVVLGCTTRVTPIK
jgi:von Willebrand factor type A domain